MNRRAAAGFTLLEVMISIALISLIVVIMAGAMRLSYRSIDRGEVKSNYLERLKVSFSLIDDQIQSAIPLVRRDDEEGRIFFEGSSDTVKFASNYSLTAGQRGYVIVTYRTRPGDEGTGALFVEENTVGVENTREIKLLEGISGVRFEYFRRESEAEEAAGEWVDTWTDELLFPRKIRVTLTFPERKIVFTVPIRANKVKT
ncbi:MAG: ral secretion pathway protein GspJ [Deltaproteobacteria bacterium]|nr:ral secretion pathway protein GspJ [Deltaproteobacteria bacterium]